LEDVGDGEFAGTEGGTEGTESYGTKPHMRGSDDSAGNGLDHWDFLWVLRLYRVREHRHSETMGDDGKTALPDAPKMKEFETGGLARNDMGT